MIEHPEPKVVVSKCLGFKKCRYNGQKIPDEFVQTKLIDHVNYLPVCPEEEIGLGTPRNPIRIGRKEGELRMVQPATGKDVTDKMRNFTEEFLGGLEDIDGFLMKNRSPSCGINDVKVYHHLDEPTGSDRGQGFFGGKLNDYFPLAAIEDEGRLNNFRIREHFLTKLFTKARFKELKKDKDIGALMDFHGKHKYLFLAYNEEAMREAGKIVANHEDYSIGEVYSKYEEKIKEILKNKAKYTAIINSLHHAFGGISDNLSSDEKEFFLNSVEEYRDERIPLSTVIHMLKSYALRFDNDYLKNQVLLEPYPKELMDITDSGKGRDY